MNTNVGNVKQDRELLLMTGTISPFVPTILSAEEERCRQYIESIKRYIIESPYTDIVFAENSEYDFSVHAKELIEIAESHNKRFEYFHCVSLDHRNCIGEAEAALMKSALDNSILINSPPPEKGSIWKVTGRLYIENCNQIVRKAKGRNCFIFSTLHPREWVSTYYFKAERYVFYDFLLGEKTMSRLQTGEAIEHVFCDCLYNNNLSIETLSAYPIIKDRRNSGGGTYNRTPLRYALCQILLLFGFNSKRK